MLECICVFLCLFLCEPNCHSAQDAECLQLLRQRKIRDFCWKLRDWDSNFWLCFFYSSHSFLKNEPKQVTRESWMTELPPELKSFGFGPRTFKRRADDKSGDRSIWTDTPADRERKAKVSIYSFIYTCRQYVCCWCSVKTKILWAVQWNFFLRFLFVFNTY